MSNEQKTSGWARFYTILKTLFLLLVVLQFVPGIINKIKHNFDDTLSARPQIGYMPINSMLTNARSYLKRLEDFEKDEKIGRASCRERVCQYV